MSHLLSYEDSHRSFDRSVILNRYKPIRGFVDVFVNGIKTDEHLENLVVLNGRSMILQKIFNKTASGDTDLLDYTVTHFAIGGGGSFINSDSTVSLVGPSYTDTNLYNAHKLNVSSYLSTPLKTVTGTSFTSITDTLTGVGSYFTSEISVGDVLTIDSTNYTVTDINSNTELTVSTTLPSPITSISVSTPQACKPIAEDDYDFTANADYSDYNTTMVLTCPITTTDLSHLGADSLKIDEAGLFATYSTNPPQLFAHIVFPYKNLSSSDEITIQWSIFA